MAELHVALVGCAHIHTPQFRDRLQQRPEFKVAAVWNHSKPRAEAYASKFGATAPTKLTPLNIETK